MSSTNKAINDIIQFQNGKWEFADNSGLGGEDANKYSRLNEYVVILRRGRYSR